MSDAEWCGKCEAPTLIVDESTEQSQWPHDERDYLVTRFACGHETTVLAGGPWPGFDAGVSR